MLSICVERGAERLNRNASLTEKTLIRPELMDSPVYGKLPDIQAEMTDMHERITYK
jgi:hypothetical protein